MATPTTTVARSTYLDYQSPKKKASRTTPPPLIRTIKTKPIDRERLNKVSKIPSFDAEKFVNDVLFQDSEESEHLSDTEELSECY